MRHHVDIFQQQLQYETLAAVATPLQMNILPGHRRLMVETLKKLKLLVLALVGCQPFFWLAGIDQAVFCNTLCP